MSSRNLLSDLHELAFDLTWTWDDRIASAFSALSPQLWERCQHNPMRLLAEMEPEAVERALGEPAVRLALDAARTAWREYRERPGIGSPPFTTAYFSMEFGLTESLPIYAGGLGVLAGDHLKAASELGLMLVGVGLLYRQGYGRQCIDDLGRQIDLFSDVEVSHLPLRPAIDPAGRPLTIDCPLGDRIVRLAVWQAHMGKVRLILLDSDLEANPVPLRSITDRLYPAEPARRLPQEIVLGVGGVRALRALGISPSVFHMNEGHGFMVAIEQARQVREQHGVRAEQAEAEARSSLVFTSHTPVAAGSDYFEPELVASLLGPYLADTGLTLDRFLDLGRREPGNAREYFCTTRAALRSAGRSAGVSRLHGLVSRRLWKDAWPVLPAAQVPGNAITNGVHVGTWMAPPIARLLQQCIGDDWPRLDPDDPRWAGVERIPNQELWECHQGLRRHLVTLAREQAIGGRLDPDVLTIGFSRRFAVYKRPGLILFDQERLHRLLSAASTPVQIVFAGKAHPEDRLGKEEVSKIVDAARHSSRIAFLPDYDLAQARLLVQGSDVWLNTPKRFFEASGTSGMKASVNGVLNLSILDGWWDEGYSPTIGWAIPSAATLDHPEPDDRAESNALYDLLEEEVVPRFYGQRSGDLPEAWAMMMKAAIRQVASHFSALRMVRDYYQDCYMPAFRGASSTGHSGRLG
jgi:glycogen phosphorylase